MLPVSLLIAVPFLAAALAAWGIWRRKWGACLPAVVVGVLLFLPSQWLVTIDNWIVAFALHVEPRNLVMTWLLVDAAAVGCLVALWAGWSRASWFWRLSALAGVPAALSLVKANEPIALAFVVMPVVAVGAWGRRRASDKLARGAIQGGEQQQRRLRWKIRDVLLLFIPVGLAALAIRSLAAGPLFINWTSFWILANSLAALGLLPVLTGTSAGWLRWSLGLLTCCVFIPAVTVAFVRLDNDVLGLAYFFEQPYIGDVGSGLFLMAVVGIPAMIGLVSWIYAWWSRAASHGPSSRVPAALLLLAAAALGVPLLFVGFLMLPPTFRIERLPPSPTYDRLIAAGKRIRPLVPSGRPAAKLKPETDAVAEILEQPGHVWMDVDQFAARELSRQYDLSFDALHHIVYGLEVEIARAEARGDFAESARLGELQLRLARVMSKGGIMIHWAIASAAELRGRAAIDFAAPHLNAGELDRLLKLLQEHERSQITIGTMIAYHDYWNWTAFGWRERFFQAARRLTGDNKIWLTIDDDRLRSMRQTDLASLRLLQTRLAIELYRRSNGVLPDSLDQLVPEQLPAMPLDPWTDRPLIYRRDGDRFVLYSTWSDRKDNGGRFLTDMKGANDFGSDIGYDLDPGFDRRGNPWPRNDPAVMGTTPTSSPPLPMPQPPASN